VREVRGLGLMLGMVLDGAGGDVVARCLEAGLLINCTADRVLRLTPPLIVTAGEVDEAVDILDRALGAA
jgi:acetylornithine/succinyldiaminopimelate/putrescine aminotransferase